MILVIARAAGETAPIMAMGAVIFVPIDMEGAGRFIPYALNEQFMALSNHLNLIAKDVPGISDGHKFGSAEQGASKTWAYAAPLQLWIYLPCGILPNTVARPRAPPLLSFA